MYVASTICGKQMHFSHPLAVADSSRVARVVIKIIPTAEAASSWLRTCPSVYHPFPVPLAACLTQKNTVNCGTTSSPWAKRCSWMRLLWSKCAIQFAQQTQSSHVCACVCVCILLLLWCLPEIVASIAAKSKEMTSRKQKRIETAFNEFFHFGNVLFNWSKDDDRHRIPFRTLYGILMEVWYVMKSHNSLHYLYIQITKWGYRLVRCN